MLIIAEKPSVAKDFADVLSCKRTGAIYSDGKTTITNCVGHLFRLEEPKHYSSENFPIIPERFDYCINPRTAEQAAIVTGLLKKHRDDTILIATDADREGEIIARECLLMAGISDFSRIKRFWVSQALTAEVILNGIKNARPLAEYTSLADQGFARQHADWLVGMNFSRYISCMAKARLPVGRVQTAVLSAISERCKTIQGFKSEKYFEHYGIFRPTRVSSGAVCRGIYFEDDKTGFADSAREARLRFCIGKTASLIDSRIERKTQNPPQLYNLNALQKDAFKFFEYPADRTLKILQSLYEELKCVSYPRTPSRVMGSGNVELCVKIADSLCCSTLSHSHPNRDFNVIRTEMDISLSNKRCFNDARLEAHHALIPLKDLETEDLLNKATKEQLNIYSLILDRFFEAFLPPCEYEKQTFILEVNANKFRVTGRKTIEGGWKNFSVRNEDDNEKPDGDSQTLEDIDWNSLTLTDVETKEIWTKPPAYFNEASILSFMENPKHNGEPIPGKSKYEKLVGLGTPATRHTFIPKLIDNGYIEIQSKNFICTKLGDILLDALRNSPLKSLADISETTSWEKKLAENPLAFEERIKDFVKVSANQEIKIDRSAILKDDIICPLCGKPVKESSRSWFCTGYKDGCTFKSLWKEARGAVFSKADIRNLCEGKKTGIKKCTKKDGGNYECRFILNKEHSWELEPLFEKKRN